MYLNRPTRSFTINSLESLDDRIVPSSLGASTPVAIDIQFNGVTAKTLASFEKELTNHDVKLAAISAKTDTAVGTAPKSELAAIADLKHMSTLTVVTKSTVAATPAAAPAVAPVSSLLSTKGGAALATIYQEYLTYEEAGGQGTFSPPQASQYFIYGTSIKLQISTAVANETVLIGELDQLGMQIDATATPGQVAIIEGFMPIAQLPRTAADPYVIAMPPIHKPNLRAF